MFRAGILSDTHLVAATEQFKEIAARAFDDCDMIFHAGDITAMEILEQFHPKPVHAVHGNMCGYAARMALPQSKIIVAGGFTIALCHGAGPRHNIEERMWAQFPEADCIIYGHTHQPVCERKGGILFINPGSFQCTSAFGSPASYAILTIDGHSLNAKLHTIRTLR